MLLEDENKIKKSIKFINIQGHKSFDVNSQMFEFFSTLFRIKKIQQLEKEIIDYVVKDEIKYSIRSRFIKLGKFLLYQHLVINIK